MKRIGFIVLLLLSLPAVADGFSFDYQKRWNRFEEGLQNVPPDQREILRTRTAALREALSPDLNLLTVEGSKDFMDFDPRWVRPERPLTADDIFAVLLMKLAANPRRAPEESSEFLFLSQLSRHAAYARAKDAADRGAFADLDRKAAFVVKGGTIAANGVSRAAALLQDEP